MQAVRFSPPPCGVSKLTRCLQTAHNRRHDIHRFLSSLSPHHFKNNPTLVDLYSVYRTLDPPAEPCAELDSSQWRDEQFDWFGNLQLYNCLRVVEDCMAAMPDGKNMFDRFLDECSELTTSELRKRLLETLRRHRVNMRGVAEAASAQDLAYANVAIDLHSDDGVERRPIPMTQDYQSPIYWAPTFSHPSPPPQYSSAETGSAFELERTKQMPHVDRPTGMVQRNVEEEEEGQASEEAGRSIVKMLKERIAAAAHAKTTAPIRGSSHGEERTNNSHDGLVGSMSGQKSGALKRRHKAFNDAMEANAKANHLVEGLEDACDPTASKEDLDLPCCSSIRSIEEAKHLLNRLHGLSPERMSRLISGQTAQPKLLRTNVHLNAGTDTNVVRAKAETALKALLEDPAVEKYFNRRYRFFEPLFRRRRLAYIERLCAGRVKNEKKKKYQQFFVDHPDQKALWPDNKGSCSVKWPSPYH
eukprot:GHVS01064019.1.p1 GENE.GHVS01064019.1~~GHVS01064019.1.p1  ORF type:complete len:524 (-),score=97.04 GHVS01064019.1:254-1669(-)